MKLILRREIEAGRGIEATCVGVTNTGEGAKRGNRDRIGSRSTLTVTPSEGIPPVLGGA